MALKLDKHFGVRWLRVAEAILLRFIAKGRGFRVSGHIGSWRQGRWVKGLGYGFWCVVLRILDVGFVYFEVQKLVKALMAFGLRPLRALCFRIIS